MSVLIKDMEMPDNCDVCLFSDWNNLHQTACCKLKKHQAVFHDYSTEYREKRSDMCPLFEASELCGDAEFWHRRADYYSDMCSKLIADMGAGVKIEAVKIDETGITFTKKKPSEQPDRSLWFRIGEICVDESKGFISAGRAIEKIRELLRETERSGEGVE